MKLTEKFQALKLHLKNHLKVVSPVNCSGGNLLPKFKTKTCKNMIVKNFAPIRLEHAFTLTDVNCFEELERLLAGESLFFANKLSSSYIGQLAQHPDFALFVCADRQILIIPYTQEIVDAINDLLENKAYHKDGAKFCNIFVSIDDVQQNFWTKAELTEADLIWEKILLLNQL